MAALAIVPVATHAGNKEKILHSFSCTDGCYPPTGLVMDKAGRMYGVTQRGGSANVGTVFSVTARGKFKTLHEFQGGSDGQYPLGSLATDGAGNLYGTTYGGGADCGCGVVFKINRRGKESVLYAFTDTNGDGANPLGGLIPDEAGNLYGTTYYGGAQERGTVFKVSPSGEATILHAFTGGSDGSYPHAGLVADTSGNLYGTTEQGGGADCVCGTVFRLKNGTKEKVLYAFTNGTEGGAPETPLAIDDAGDLYGTTISGGTYGFGSVFHLSHSGKITALYSFVGDTDGAEPLGGVIIGADGNLYGTTPMGGTSLNTVGTVFRLSRKGDLNVLHSFAGQPDGAQPQGELVMDAKGHLYGTTVAGGENNDGIIYRLEN